MKPKLLVIDNYDSFTYNLVQMFRQYPLAVHVFRSDEIGLAQVEQLSPDYFLISPGPKDPMHAGICMSLIEAWFHRAPILGVCLGMQCINEVFNGQTVSSPQPLHGKTSAVFHQGRGVFSGIESPFQAARYHSLAIKPDPAALQETLTITARTADRIIMGISHGKYPLHGIQFHPESFLTEHGFRMVENFLNMGPLEKADELRRVG